MKVLGIALTDTFGTHAFLEAFRRPVPEGLPSVSCSSSVKSSKDNDTAQGSDRDRREAGGLASAKQPLQKRPTYANIFSGIRQDSGDPREFIKLMQNFYREEGILEQKTIVFSDSLNLELCLQYKAAAEAAGFIPTFGIGTFITSTLRQLLDNRLKHMAANFCLQMTLVGIQMEKNLYRPI